MKKGYCLVAIDAGQQDRQSTRQLAYLAENYLREADLWASAIERGKHLAVLVGSMDPAALREVVEKFTQYAAKKGFEVRAGISAASQAAGGLRLEYQQALDALQAFNSQDQRTRTVWTYDELGYLGEMLARPAESRPPNLYTRMLEKMEAYDSKKNTRYLSTLETYLDHQTRPNQAAKNLFIHRNTLYQRLQKISDLWGIDFQDPMVVLNYHLAVKDWRLKRPD